MIILPATSDMDAVIVSEKLCKTIAGNDSKRGSLLRKNEPGYHW